ncbi:MAG: NUDIX hydrolase [Cytophagales bacterium]|nr:MAG: NUDIX hydrolase [Cytophagales bacterium]
MNLTEKITQTFGNQLRVRVSAVCFQDNALLLVKHQMPSVTRPYLWAPPGGGMHFGETVSTTLQREMKEETGLEIAIARFLFINEYLEPPLHALELFFHCHITGGTLITGNDPEMQTDQQIIKEVQFLTLEALQKEPPLAIHSRFRNLSTWEAIFQSQTYYESRD